MRKLLMAQDGLNRSQQEAIARAMTRSITLWQARTQLSLVCSARLVMLCSTLHVLSFVLLLPVHTKSRLWLACARGSSCGLLGAVGA